MEVRFVEAFNRYCSLIDVEDPSPAALVDLAELDLARRELHHAVEAWAIEMVRTGAIGSRLPEVVAGR